MKREWLIIIGAIILCPILLFFGFIFFQKPFVSLVVNGKVVATARRSFFAPITSDGSVDIYAGKQRIFSLREDICDEPIFIYPFADGKRFLCDYDNDVSMLDFVVDLNTPPTGEAGPPKWPADDNVRGVLSSQMTNIVFNAKGVVRLPNYSELQEVLNYLAGKTPTTTRAGHFFCLNFWDAEFLTLDLATNRQSLWPVEK